MRKHVVVIGTSLDPGSRSQILAREAERQLAARQVSVTRIDLREYELPGTGRPGSWEHAEAAQIQKELERATHLLLAVPVYNFGIGSSTKGLLELVGGAMTGKTVGFLVAAGGPRAYMAVLGLANSVMLDFRCWIVPRFVYATTEDFEGDKIRNAEIVERIGTLTQEMFVHEMGE